MKIINTYSAFLSLVFVVFTISASAQKIPDIGFTSVGRGAPVAVDANTLPMTGALIKRGFLGFDPAENGQFIGAARPGETPKNIEPLARDIFTSDDFYQDRDLWTDPRYYRCNSPAALEDLWGGTGNTLIGNNPPGSAAWGYCDRDYPREAIVSPYTFKTAPAHYQALLAETKQRGGPTQHTYASVPGEWTGVYAHSAYSPNPHYWFRMRHIQLPTVLSLLTEEYRQRMVQEAYHHANSNKAQWPSSYCWPEGFMRRWHAAAIWERQFVVTPHLVQMLGGVARNFVTNIHIGREFNMEGTVPRLGADVPRWYGETIGFWDHDTLITWTSNVQAWGVHAAFEYSGKMQTIEIYTPNHDKDGKFIGLNHEAIFYDPEALVEPIRIVRNYYKENNFNDARAQPIVFVECIQSIFPVDGTATPVSPGVTIELEVPDMYGRPWAHIWEKYWEEGMEKPEETDDIFSFD